MTSGPHSGAPVAAAEVPGISAPSSTLAQRLAHGSAIYGVATFSLKGVGFALVALYTRYMVPADYGIVALAETVAIVVATVSGLGLDGASRRLYFQYANDRRQLDAYVSTVLRFGALATFAVLVAAMALGPWLLRMVGPRFSIPFFPYVAIALGTAAGSQWLDYRLGLYQTEGQARNFALLSGASVLTTGACVIALVVVARRGAVGMLEGKLIAAAAMALVAALLCWPRVRAPFSWRYVRETLPLSLPLVPHQFMALGLVVADRFILQRYRDLGEVGVYSLAYTFGMAMFLVATAIMQAWSPLFFETAEQGGDAAKKLGRLATLLVVFLAMVAVIGIAIAQPFVRLVISPQYGGAGRLIPWIIVSYLMHAMFSLFQLAAMQGKRSGRIWAASVSALAINLALNFSLIPSLGAYGAAYATLAAYAVEAALMYVFAQRSYRIEYGGGKLAWAVGITAVVLAGSQWAPNRWALVWPALLLLAGLAGLWKVAGLRSREVLKLIEKLRRGGDGALPVGGNGSTS